MAEVISSVLLIWSDLESAKPYMEMQIEQGRDWLEPKLSDVLIWCGGVVYKRGAFLSFSSGSLFVVGCGAGSL